MNILTDLAENAESESVRLGATRDLLYRAGFRPVDRHEIKEKSVEELNAQLVSLVGENGAEMIISAFRSRRSLLGMNFCPGISICGSVDDFFTAYSNSFNHISAIKPVSPNTIPTQRRFPSR